MDQELKSGIEKALKTLRQADDQSSAVAWMKDAYRLLEACLACADAPVRGLFVVPDVPKLLVSQRIEATLVPHFVESRPENKTVVYPSIFLPPGLKPLPKPWTREDTRRLERAAATPTKRIQRLGK